MPQTPNEKAVMKGFLLVGVILLVVLTGFSATLVLSASNVYEQSSCAPRFPQDCAGYSPSSFNGGPGAAAQGEPIWTALFATIAAILAGFAGKTWFDNSSHRASVRSISIGLALGVVLALVLTTASANIVSYPANEYHASTCTPTVPGGCTGYSPSSYSVGAAQGNWPDALFFALLAVAGAFYLGSMETLSRVGLFSSHS